MNAKMLAHPGPNARPAQTTKPDLRLAMEPWFEKRRKADADALPEPPPYSVLADEGVKMDLVCYMIKPGSTVQRASFSMGLPPGSWRSEIKANFAPEVFSGDTHARY